MSYISENQQKEAELPIGVLTAENRDKWAEICGKFESLDNQETLAAIDSALFASLSFERINKFLP